MSTRSVRVTLAAAFAVVLVVLAVIGRATNNTSTEAEAAATQPQPSADAGGVSTVVEPEARLLDAADPQPGDQPSVAGTGFERTELGARTAAAVYLEATEEIVHMTPTDAAQAQRDISTAAAGDGLAAEVEEQMIDLVAQTPQGLELWLAPMEARSIETPDGYEVSIWYAEVVAVGTAAAVDNWRTITFKLVWENDTWLIDSKVSVVGPVPGRGSGLVVTPPATLVSILGTYDDNGLTPGQN